jgi:hypothetical protein
MQRFKPAFDLTLSKYLPHMQRLSKALECTSSEIPILQRPLTRRSVTGAITSVFGWAINRNRPARLVASPIAAFSSVTPSRMRSPDARGNADARLERNTRSRGAYGVDDGEPSAHRPLGIVLMRSRIPKVSEHPIAEMLRHHAI